MTQNVHQKFTERENQLRLYVIQFTIDRQRAFHLERDEEEAVCALQMSHEEYETIIERLIERDGMVVDEEKNVNFIYPISALETSHRVVLEDGRQFFRNFEAFAVPHSICNSKSRTKNLASFARKWR